MANPSIGGIEVIQLGVALENSGRTLEDITPPNVDGVSLRKKGKRFKRKRGTLIIPVLTAAACVTTEASMQALRDDLQTVVDDQLQTHTGVAITDIHLVRVQSCTGVVGWAGDPKFKLYFDIELQKTVDN